MVSCILFSFLTSFVHLAGNINMQMADAVNMLPRVAPFPRHLAPLRGMTVNTPDCLPHE